MKAYISKYFDQDVIDEKINPLSLGKEFLK